LLRKRARGLGDVRRRPCVLATDADGDRLVSREFSCRLESEGTGEQRVVAERRMPVEREVGRWTPLQKRPW
jgi:hypothetical protein